MGFIDWLTKESNTEVQAKDETEILENTIEKENFEEEITSLRELANNERMETAEFMQADDSFSPIDNEYDYFDNQMSTIASTSTTSSASFTIFKVSDEEDVRQVLKHLSTNSSCIATFENVKKKEFALIMKYLQGGTFVLGANMSEWQKDAYIIVPRGMTINMQEKSRRK